MSPYDAMQLTRENLLGAPPPERARLVEAYLLGSVRALRAAGGADGQVTADTPLADLAIDSIQVVELKFGLDQLVGIELDVELILTNPTIRELSEYSVVDAGLA